MTLATILLVVNGALAAVAATANYVEAREGPRQWRAMRVATTVLAALYVVGYAVALAPGVDRAEWSRTMVMLGPSAWVAVWVWPPLRARQLRHRTSIDGIDNIDLERITSAHVKAA